MAGIAVDNLLHAATRRASTDGSATAHCLARFIVTKHSWRDDPDIDGMVVPPEAEGSSEHELVLSCRNDKKLLSAAAQRGTAPTAARILGIDCHTANYRGSPTEFPAHKLRRGTWVAVVLRVTPWALERLDPATGKIKWRAEYRCMTAPALRLLASGRDDPGQALAVFVKSGRSPRVFAVRERHKLVQHIQAVALARLGITLAADSHSQATSVELLDSVAAAEREIAGTREYAPLAEWEVRSVVPVNDTLLPYQALLTARGSDRQTTAAVLAQSRRRRLVLTLGALLERRPTTYEVADRRQLGQVSALVRFVDEPEWLGVEWADGGTASMYVTPAREALLAALLDAAQACAHRPIPVLPTPTNPGDVALGNLATPCLTCPVQLDMELERMCLHHIAAACSQLDLPQLVAEGGSMMATVEEAVVAPAPGQLPAENDADSQHAPAMDSGASSDASGNVMQAAVNRAIVKLRSGQLGADGSSPTVRAMSGPMQEGVLERARQLNACVAYGGVSPTALMEDDHVRVLLSLLPSAARTNGATKPLTVEETCNYVTILQCLQRVSSSPHIAASLLATPGWASTVTATLQSGSEAVAMEAARLLTRLWAPTMPRTGVAPWHAVRGLVATEDDPRALLTAEETSLVRAAKAMLLTQPARAKALVDTLRSPRPVLPVLSMAVVEAVAACCCEPCSRTTMPTARQAVLGAVAALGRPLFGLFSHPAASVTETAALIMRCIAQDGAAAAAPMREGALSEGALLHHLLGALGLGPKAELSRELVSMWADEFGPALNLMRRIFPVGLMRSLNQRVAVPKPTQEGPGPQNMALPAPPAPAQPPQTAAQPPVQAAPAEPPLPVSRAAAGPLSPAPAAPMPRTPSTSAPINSPPPSTPAALAAAPAVVAVVPRPSLKGNWAAFWEACMTDHCSAGLMWNERTRQELRDALHAEEQALRLGRMKVADRSGGRPSWNHWEFHVDYPSLARTLCVGGVYLRLLLEGTGQGAIERLAAPRDFFHSCYHRFLCLADSALQAPVVQDADSALSVYIETDPDTDRALCARAMAEVYSVHAAVIGSFEGITHIARLLDLTRNGAMRDTMLLLLEQLLIPSAAETQLPAQRAARANGQAFVEAGGIALLVDVVACCHQGSERTALTTPSGTNLLASSAAAIETHEWFWYEHQAVNKVVVEQDEQLQREQQGDADKGTRVTAQEDARRGPVTRAALRQLYRKGTVDAQTLVWAEPMLEPQPFDTVRELRWMVASRGTLPGFVPAVKALRMLQALADMQRAVDAQGEVLQPLPRAHRDICAASCLPHVAQAILTNEPDVVAAASTLLCTAAAHNAATLPRLYSTGVYFFALGYCGSNLLQIAELFKATHLLQHWEGPQPSTAGLSLAQRSFLGPLLPESLLYVLETHGPAAFATTLVADSDTPELVWTHEMRGQLVAQMLRHIGDFPAKLRQHCHAEYVFTPCPPIGYAQLSEELWCHRYYLRNLCDEERFADWPIVDHVPLLQSLLEAWRAELARKPLSMTETEACAVLEVVPDADGIVAEDELKAAYRKLARRFHPDKNPAGRDRFLAIQRAYERLQAGAAGGQGPQAWRVLLLLRTQCILYRRYPEVLAPFKYAGYPLLLTSVTSALDEGGSGEQQERHFLGPSVAPPLTAAVQLCSLTCVSSALNGEELTRSGGVATLGGLLQRCAAVTAADVVQHVPEALLITHALGALAGMAAFPLARGELLQRESLVSDIVRACGMTRAPAAVDAALACIINMTEHPDLQTLLLNVGVLGYCVPLLFFFDVTHTSDDDMEVLQPPTAKGPGFLRIGVERTNQQAARNRHALLAARALGRLAGLLQGGLATPACEPARAALSALLTEPLLPRLAEDDPRPLLTDLNSSVATPQAMWNGSMREELLSAMEAQRVKVDVGILHEHRYKALAGELVIAGVFVRVFDEQPAFAVTDPAALCRGLVTYLHTVVRPPQADTSATAWLPAPPPTGTLPEGSVGGTPAWVVGRAHLLCTLRALSKLLEAVPKVAKLLTTTQTLAPLLNCLEPAAARRHAGQPQGNDQQGTWAFESDVACGALAAMVRLTQLAACVEAMAEARCILLALWTVHRPPSHAALVLALRVLHALAPTPAAAWAAGCHAGAVYLLTQLLPRDATAAACTDDKEAQQTVRVACASLLGRLLAQPLHGPRVRLLLTRLLPEGLVASLADGPADAAAAAMRESAETPERLWTRDMALVAAEELDALAMTARTQQAATPDDPEWTLPQGFAMPYRHGDNQLLFVGGVYVQLYLRNPQHPLRDPKAFLEGLLQALLAGGVDDDVILTLGSAATVLSTAHPLLAQHAVGLGYVDKLIRLLAARVPTEQGSAVAVDSTGGAALRLLHAMASSPAVVVEVGLHATPTATALLAARGWGIAGSVLALETLKRLLQGDAAPLAAAVVAAGWVDALLQILQWHQQGEGEERDRAVERVLAVDVLHALSNDDVAGGGAAGVRERLGGSEVWQAYSQQRHDLFLPSGDVSNGGGVVALLKGSQVERFALPAGPSTS